MTDPKETDINQMKAVTQKDKEANAGYASSQKGGCPKGIR